MRLLRGGTPPEAIAAKTAAVAAEAIARAGRNAAMTAEAIAMIAANATPETVRQACAKHLTNT
jgi:hypothetical protein